VFEITFVYWYKGAACCHLYLEKDELDYIKMINDYGEVMFYVSCGEELVNKMNDLKSDLC
jgi:hypothetical protein